MTQDDPVSELVSSSNDHTFEFSQTWFEEVQSDWEHLARPLSTTKDGVPQKIRILEIGSFEGASTTWMLNNLMGHVDSCLTAVDTFEGGMEHKNAKDFSVDGLGGAEYHLSTLEARFRHNVSRCQNAEKLRVIQALSSQALIQLHQENASFDLIYIDGSHVASDVLLDAVLSWRLLQIGGTLVFDDSRWKGYLEDCYNPRVAVMSFLQCVKQEAKSKETEFQTWVTKMPCFIQPTPNPDPAQCYWDNNYLRYTSYP